MSILSNLDLIRRVPLFQALAPAQAEAVAQAVSKQRYKRGDVLVEQGKKSDHLGILLTGRARVLSTDERGREVILATMGPGEHFGEMSLIDNQAHSATVRADVQTDVLLLGRAEFARCLSENNTLAYMVMKGLVQRLRQANRAIESLALLDVYGRVVRVLKESGREESPGHWILEGKVSRQDVAKMIGASREMVSRVLKDLEERGFVQSLPDGRTAVRDQISFT